MWRLFRDFASATSEIPTETEASFVRCQSSQFSLLLLLLLLREETCYRLLFAGSALLDGAKWPYRGCSHSREDARKLSPDVLMRGMENERKMGKRVLAFVGECGLVEQEKRMAEGLRVGKKEIDGKWLSGVTVFIRDG